MSSLTIFRNGAAPAAAFKNIPLPTTRLDEGTGGAPWARISYKGKDWAIKNGAKTELLARTVDGVREKNPNLDVVILDGANHPTKRWYEKGWQDGDNNAPDCYSTLGLRPDAGAAKKQDGGQGCLLCPQNGWGSKPGSRGKACSDYKHLAVVPVGDIENKIYGGPMLLAVPPNSLKALARYQTELEANSFHYAMVHTRVTFGEGLFEFAFDAMEALDEVQAEQVGRMVKHPLIRRMLDEEGMVPSGDADGQPAQATATVHVLKPVGHQQAALAAPEPAKPAVPPASPALTPEQEKLAAARAELAAMKAAKKAAEIPPEPEQTPEQKELAAALAELAAMKAQLAGQAGTDAAPAKRRGAPRGPRTPAVAPTNMTSETVPAALETMPGERETRADVPAPGNPADDDAMRRINQTLANASKLV